MKKEDEIKLKLDREKYNYEISRNFLLILFDKYVIISIGIIGFYIGILQIHLNLERAIYIVIITIIFLIFFFYFQRNYNKSKMVLENELKKSSQIIDSLYDQILKK